jgi:hypothetical protein
MSIGKTLFPPSNRQAALVAFLRTFWQVIRPPIALGGLALGTLATTGVLHLDLKVLGIIAGAAVLSAVVSGVLAAGDILKNGLPNAYTNAAVASIPAAVVSTVPVLAPADPSQPAAGVPPADV